MVLQSSCLVVAGVGFVGLAGEQKSMKLLLAWDLGALWGAWRVTRGEA